MKDLLIFEKSKKGKTGYVLPVLDVPEYDLKSIIPEKFLRTQKANLPEVSEVELVRHFTELSKKNFGVDLGFYPLGSCTMKYNPKINEDTASLDSFINLHPLQPHSSVQGTLELMHTLLTYLCEITGMKWGSLQPFAGAHGEFLGMKLFKAYFDANGEDQRTKILVPDSSHGTNPASAHLAGFDVVEIKSNKDGMISLESIEEHLNENLAGIMLTNPNTLGVFEKDIVLVAKKVHKAGGLLYYDGANLNAIMSKCRPGDMGFDVVHLNLHKTFSTPHGGGGPGSGPVLVKEKLLPYLPEPDVKKTKNGYELTCGNSETIGRISGFYGNIGVCIKAFTYILSMGKEGLKRVSELAVLNANYLKEKLKGDYLLPYDRLCKHEFVLSAQILKEKYGVTALHIAKALIDNGIHPPTIYFPLIVHEALMIEPTETEPKDVLDNFIKVMRKLRDMAESSASELQGAPQNASVTKVDEVLAARKPVVRWSSQE